MKKKDLHLIGVEQELIDRLFLFKKQIKELKNIIDSNKNELCKYKKDKTEKNGFEKYTLAPSSDEPYITYCGT